METLLRILREMRPDVDFEKETDLVERRVLDSLTIVMLVGDLQDAFDIEISPLDIVPENFQSADAIYAMITRSHNEKFT